MSLQPAVEPVCCNHAPSDICNRKFGGLSQSSGLTCCFLFVLGRHD